jgi:hypothetical protein
VEVFKKVIIAGKVFSFWYLIAIFVIMFVTVSRATKQGKVPTLRKLPGIVAIEEAVGRATEMGRPVHYSAGTGGLSGTTAAQTFSGVALLGYTARLAAKYDVPLLVTVCGPEVFPLAEETVANAYRMEGKTESLKSDTVRYISNEQFSYAAALFGLLAREKPAANLMLGLWEASSIMVAEVGASVGAVQIAGTANASQIPFFACACDYTLIGEELMTAGAYVSQDKVQLGSVFGQDLIKVSVIAIILVGVLLKLAKSSFLEDLLKL